MTKEELKIAEEKYLAKMANNKIMRAELDLDIRKFIFGPEIHILIRTLGEIIFYAAAERKSTFFEDDGSYQTQSGKRRTVEDIYKLQRFYNIKCRFKDVKLAFETLVDNNFLEVVFCKKTLVNTYSINNLGTTKEDIENCLKLVDLNFEIIKPKQKKYVKKI